MQVTRSTDFLRVNEAKIKTIVTQKLEEINNKLIIDGYYADSYHFQELAGVAFAAMICVGQKLDQAGWNVNLQWRAENEAIICDITVSVALDVKFG